jgi:hypothetical protein
MSSDDSSNRKRYRFADRKHKDFIHEFVVDAETLVSYFTEHPDISPFIPFIPEVAKAPYEIWQMFQKNAVTDQVRLRHSFVKSLKLKEKGEHGFVLVFEAIKGAHTSVEFLVFHGEDLHDRLNQHRAGKLIYAQDD